MRKARGVVQERSAGAVVVWEGEKHREYLLLRYGAGHWGFPKGHVEAGETDAQAAKREVAEETAIPPERQHFVAGFRESTPYTFHRGRTRVDKDVTFFLVTVDSKDVRISHEHTGFAWFPYDAAMQQLSFDGPRRVLHAAHAFLDRRAAAPREPPSRE